jgi:hypothetical protein
MDVKSCPPSLLPKTIPVPDGRTRAIRAAGVSDALFDIANLRVDIVNRAIDPLQALEVTAEDLHDLRHRILVRGIFGGREPVDGVNHLS